MYFMESEGQALYKPDGTQLCTADVLIIDGIGACHPTNCEAPRNGMPEGVVYLKPIVPVASQNFDPPKEFPRMATDLGLKWGFDLKTLAFRGAEALEAVEKALEGLNKPVDAASVRTMLDQIALISKQGSVVAAISEPVHAVTNYESIDSAPKDGTVILTDEGTAQYVDQRHWGSPVTNGWYLCSADGNIPTCADDGMTISAIKPSKWMHLPV